MVTSYTPDDANRLIAVDGITVTNDANGNVTGDGTKTYSWDVRGRLVGMTGLGLSASFVSDYLGRRLSKTINGTATTFLNDGADVVTDTTSGVAKQTLHGPVIDEPLARDGLFFTPNHLGSTTTLTDMSGVVQQSYSYSPFGETTGSGSVANPFQFTGRENDATGLMYYRSRYYAPAWGRFISEDPIGLAGGLNQYSYANNSPVMYADPDGKFLPLVFGGVVLLLFLASERPPDVVPPGYQHRNVYLELSDALYDNSQLGCGGLMSSFSPGGSGLVDPRILQAGRQVLEGERVLNSWRLRAAGSEPPPIDINPEGVILNGNSRARVAAMRGELVPYRVLGQRATGYGPVLERPLYWTGREPARLPWEPQVGIGEAILGIVRSIVRFFRP